MWSRNSIVTRPTIIGIGIGTGTAAAAAASVEWESRTTVKYGEE